MLIVTTVLEFARTADAAGGIAATERVGLGPYIGRVDHDCVTTKIRVLRAPATAGDGSRARR
jgi:hypothetical protein